MPVSEILKSRADLFASGQRLEPNLDKDIVRAAGCRGHRQGPARTITLGTTPRIQRQE